ncbi:MAG: hypothetical protein KDA52_18800 [Planctomycetaceae bacterium]|nr:hypothetical protein [Planctomycetaceae bacterium]
MTSIVEQHYQAAMSALTPCQRMERCAALTAWGRQMIAGRIIEEQGPLNDVELKWQVALRIYGSDPRTRRLIEQGMANVSD